MKLTKEKTAKYINLILNAKQDQMRPNIRDIAMHENLTINELTEFSKFFKDNKDKFKITIELRNQDDYSLITGDVDWFCIWYKTLL